MWTCTRVYPKGRRRPNFLASHRSGTVTLLKLTHATRHGATASGRVRTHALPGTVIGFLDMNFPHGEPTVGGGRVTTRRAPCTGTPPRPCPLRASLRTYACAQRAWPVWPACAWFFLRALLHSRAPYIPFDARCQTGEKAGEAALSSMCSSRQPPALSRRVFFSQLSISSRASAAETASVAVAVHDTCFQAGWQVETHSANAPAFSPPASQPVQQSQQQCTSHGLKSRTLKKY